MAPGRFGHGRLGQGPGQTEVGDPQTAVLVEDEVGRLDVTVDETATVGVGQSLGRLDPDGRRLGHRDPAAVVEEIAQRAAPQVLEDEEGTPVVLAPVVDGEDMGMGQRRRPTGPRSGSGGGRTRRRPGRGAGP